MLLLDALADLVLPADFVANDWRAPFFHVVGVARALHHLVGILVWLFWCRRGGRHHGVRGLFCRSGIFCGVTFSLGDTELGSSVGKDRVTPFDLAGVDEAAVGGCQVDGALPDDDFRIVHNIAVLLQSFDTDGDPSEGIEISPETAALFEGININVDQPWEDFQADTTLGAVLAEFNDANEFAETRTLREREDALAALYEGIGLCPAQ